MSISKQIIAVIVLLLTTFILLMNQVNQYGISWDEPYQKILGKATYDYVFHRDPALLQLGDKYYGSFYEMVLIAGEKMFNLTETRNIYLFRHSMNFSLFFVGVISFYFFIYSIWKNHSFALVGCTLLLCYPRILADSYYNTKDIPFLVFYLLTAWSMITYLRSPSSNKLFLLAFLTALSIATRLAGVYLLMVVVVLLTMQINSKIVKDRVALKKHIWKVISYVLLSTLTTYALWPILWENPMNFYYAFQSMTAFDWDLSVLFQGSFVSASQLPWYYLPVWIGITTPIGLLLAFLIGLCAYAINFKENLSLILRSHSHSSNNVGTNIILISPLLWLPLLSVMILQPTMYDGWRHFYFLFPFIVLFGLYGLHTLWEKALFNSSFLNKFIVALLVVTAISEPVVFIAKNHPHEFVFFNRLAGNDYNQIKMQYELDYWGVSSKEVLEYLARTTTEPLIITTDSHAVVHNHALLPKEMKEKISFQEIEKIDSANIFIGSYRWHPEKYPCGQPVFSSSIQSVPLISAYDAKECDLQQLLETTVL